MKVTIDATTLRTLTYGQFSYEACKSIVEFIDEYHEDEDITLEEISKLFLEYNDPYWEHELDHMELYTNSVVARYDRGHALIYTP